MKSSRTFVSSSTTYNQDSRAKIHHNCSALNLNRTLLAAQLFKVGKCLPVECGEEDVRQAACCCC